MKYICEYRSCVGIILDILYFLLLIVIVQNWTWQYYFGQLYGPVIEREPEPVTTLSVILEVKRIISCFNQQRNSHQSM
jgi:hypothetical protein